MRIHPEVYCFDRPQRTSTHLGATLSRFDKCSSPSQNNGKWSDALDSTNVGHDPAPRRPMRVHQRCHINTLDELWYFDRPQRTRTYLGATLSRFDKCSPPSQNNRKWSDALGLTAVGHDPAPRRPMRVHQRCQMNTLDELWYFDHPQRTRTHLGATLSRFDKCSSHSQKNGKWSDALNAMAVGRVSAHRHSMRVHQRCHMNTLDELWYFDCRQRTRIHLGRPFPGLTNAAPPPRKMRNDQMRLSWTPVWLAYPVLLGSITSL